MILNMDSCNKDCKRILNELRDILKLQLDNGGMILKEERREAPGFQIICSDNQIKIFWNQLNGFCRALLTLCKKEKLEETWTEYEEKSSFEDFGVMFDISRNAVMKTDTVKEYIKLLALMGYRFLGLYMEDTLAVKEEPYFGYQRGAMTAEELKEIDDYAKIFGLEVRAYIQTLAHLNQITRYEEYKEIIDTEDILLAGEERTYLFLENLIRTVSENLSSRKVNIGMDEAHMVGLGKYLDKHGFSNRFQIMEEHLKKVLDICRKYGLQVQMWSDMFFRLAYKGEYYEEENGEKGKKTLSQISIPEDVELIYWDYYSCHKEHYDKMLKRHLQLTNHVGFAGGAWKWTGFAPHNTYSIKTGKEALWACKENHISSVVITAWGDNGGEASHYSILPALYANAEYNYRGELETSKFSLLTGMEFHDFIRCDSVNRFWEEETLHNNASKYLLYNDIFLGTFDSVIPEDMAVYYKKVSQSLEKCCRNEKFGYLFQTLRQLSCVLSSKADMGKRIKNAYDSKDIKTLHRIAEEELPSLRKELGELYEIFLKQWEKENKPFGFEVQCIRFGGLDKRLQYAADKLKEYTAGKRRTIEELEIARKPFAYFKENEMKNLNYNLWQDIVTPSVVG